MCKLDDGTGAQVEDNNVENVWDLSERGGVHVDLWHGANISKDLQPKLVLVNIIISLAYNNGNQFTW